jgi:hypothetical protein
MELYFGIDKTNCTQFMGGRRYRTGCILPDEKVPQQPGNLQFVWVVRFLYTAVFFQNKPRDPVPEPGCFVWHPGCGRFALVSG